MSHKVEPHELADIVASYHSAPFLLYGAATGESVRVNHVRVALEQGSPNVRVTGFGRGVVARVEAGIRLSLLWPPPKDEQFSVIADGFGEFIDEDTLLISIESAVLHRPAPPLGEPRAC